MYPSLYYILVWLPRKKWWRSYVLCSFNVAFDHGKVYEKEHKVKKKKLEKKSKDKNNTTRKKVYGDIYNESP